MAKYLYVCIIALCMTCTAAAQSVTGRWVGKLQVSGGQLTLVLRIQEIEGGKLSAFMDSPDQGAYDIPCDSVVYSAPHLKVIISSIGARYEATLDGETLRGQFMQGGLSLPLVLTPSAEEDRSVLRPQEPKEPYPYQVEEVRFVNPISGDTLAGTLTMPTSPGPHRAVVMISGSGAQDRDETIMNHRPFLVWADALTRLGIAVLRYDDRGVGASTGDFSEATTTDFSRDAEAAVDYLRSRKEIDNRRIGLIGHSEGGIIAPMVATRRPDDVSFIVLLAASGVRGDSILLLQNKMISRRSNLPDSVREASAALNRSLFAMLVPPTSDEEALRQSMAEVLRKAFMDGSVASPMPHEEIELAISQLIEQLTTPWMREFLRYDPAPTLSRVLCPALAIQGSEDVHVPVAENLPAIRKALTLHGNKEVTIKEFPGLNHLFQHGQTGLPNEYRQIRETVSPEVLQFVGEWILKR
jgi:hypothetical protein